MYPGGAAIPQSRSGGEHHMTANTRRIHSLPASPSETDFEDGAAGMQWNGAD